MRRSAPSKWPGAALRVLVRAAAALAILGTAWASSGASLEALAAARPDEPRQMLVGLVVDGREVDVVDVYFDGVQFLVPLEAFLGLCECASSFSAQGVAVITPIGTVMINLVDLVERDGIEHVAESTLRERLAVRIRYDSSSYSLEFDLPWHGMASARERGPQGPRLTPDDRPPALTLSNAVFGAYYGHQRQFDIGSGNATLMGRAADGIWRVRYDDSLAGPGLLQEYGWLREISDDKLLLLGHQRFSLHSLLSSLEMTGAQMAWTNAPVEMFGDSGVGGELLPRQLQSSTTISGIGVPAGIAVLRIDDQQIAATVIGLDGIYEFQGVRLPASRTSRIEVLIYDRQNPTVPVDIQQHTQRASQAMLPGGAMVVQTALGAAGNALDRQTPGQEGFAGFVQARYGIAESLTLESTVQRGLRGNEFMAGGIAEIGRGLVASTAVGSVAGSFGYSVDLDGLFGQWAARGRSEMLQPGYRFENSPLESDQWLEVSRATRNGQFEVGIVGQYRRGRGRDVNFVLPLVAWRPSSRFQVRARPDNDGQYRIDTWWIPDGDWRLGLTRSREVTTVDVSRALSRSLRAQLVAEVDDDGGNRQAAVLSWFGQGRLAPALSAGPMLSDGSPGGLLRGQIAITSGVLLGLQYETFSLVSTPDASRDHRVTLSLSGRLGFAGGRVVPGAAMNMRSGAGGIAGRLKIAGDYRVAPEDLENVVVSVDGRAMARTQRGGRYFVPTLPPGSHRVTFDPDGLPIELTARDAFRIVEVAPGAVTQADFVLDVEFGLAGRVRLGVASYPGVVVELLDAKGGILATTLTDRFGLYRFDAVRIGRYQVRLGGDLRDAPNMPTRQVTITDDFLFDQDLDIVPRGLERRGHVPVVASAAGPAVEGASDGAHAAPGADAAGAARPAGFDVSSATALVPILPDLPTAGAVELVAPDAEIRRAEPLRLADAPPAAVAARDGVPVPTLAEVEVVRASAPSVQLAEPGDPGIVRAAPLGPGSSEASPELRAKALRFMSQLYGLSPIQR